MRAMMMFLASVAAFAVSLPGVRAAEYYVATDGQSGGTGSQADPFPAIQRAAEVVLPGDTVHVLAGTYHESVILSRSGEEGQPITFAGGGEARIDQTGNKAFDVRADHVILDGFVFDAVARGINAVDVQANHHHVIVRNFIFRNRGTADGYVPFATQSGSHDVLITGNLFQDVYNLEAVAYIWGHDQVISHNTVIRYTGDYNVVHADFVQTFGCPDWESYNILVENNLIQDSETQFFNIEGNSGWDGHAICDTPSVAIHDWTFRNNLLVNMAAAGFSHIPNTHVYNNVFYNSGTAQGYAIGFYDTAGGSADGSDVYNNVVIMPQNPQVASDGGAAVSISNNHTATSAGSLFVDAGQGNFRPADGSALIGTGRNLTDVCAAFPDPDGTPRPTIGAWDIGAYQHREDDEARPAAPTGLRVVP